MTEGSSVGLRDRFLLQKPWNPREYTRWKRWAKARLLRSNLEAADKGPLLFTFLDGVAQMMFEDIDVDGDIAVEGDEQVIFDLLDQRYLDAEPADRMAEALDAVYDLKWEHNESSTNCGPDAAGVRAGAA